jgi:hypothetical protein
VDHQVVPIMPEHGDDLEQLSVSGGAEMEDKVILQLVASHRMANGVLDVSVGDAVLTSGRVKVHTTAIVLRNPRREASGQRGVDVSHHSFPVISCPVTVEHALAWCRAVVA